ncbi:MAG: STAS domain-containing protein [Actinobacteria bacterium]|nr:STAS domain-containing protein [Actinomycetota bacterium]
MAASKAHTIAFPVSGAIALGDLPTGVKVVLCEVCDADPNAVTVDALARLQLTARRQGCEVRLRRPSEELRQLLGFMGLAEVLPETPD